MNQIEEIKSKLAGFKKKYFYNLIFKSASFFIFSIFSIVIILNLIEYYSYLSTLVKTTIFVTFLLSFSTALLLLIIKPIYKFINFNKFYSNEQAAINIGSYFPEIKDKLINTIQLESISNQELASLSLNSRASLYENINFNAALEKEKTNKPFILLLITSIFLISTLLWDSKILITGSQRLLDFNTAYEAPSPFKITPLNTPLISYKDEAFTLDFEITGKYKIDKAYILYDGQLKKLINKKNDIYSYNFNGLKKETSFQISVSGFESKKYFIKILNRPELMNGSMNIRYPGYTGIKNISTNNIGNITVPEGTRVEWLLKTENTNSIKIKIDSVNQLANKINEGFTYDLKVLKSKEYEIILENEHTKNKNRHVYSINVNKDLYPTINSNVYEDTTMFESVVLSGNIGDDYGFNSLKIKFKIEGKSNYNSINIPISKKTNNQSFYYVWNFDSILNTTTSKLEYYLEVSDNDQVNGSKKTKTKHYSFEIPNKEGLAKKIEDESNSVEDKLKKQLEKLKENDKELSKIEEKIKSKKKLDWQDKKNLKEKINQQKQLHKELEELKEKFNKLNQKQDKFKDQSESIKEKSKQLQKLMEELLDDETKKMMEELQKLLEENKPDDKKIKDLLDKMKNEESDLEKELERAIDLYKQLKLDQKMEDTAKKLEDLAKKQDQLNEETENKKSDKNKEELQKEQEEINKKFDEVKDDLKKLNEMNEELNKNDDVKEKTEDAKEEIDEDLNNANEELKKNQKQKAGKSQKSASQKMKEMSQDLKDMQMDGDSEQEEEDIETLRAILENLITLSFNQEGLANKFKMIRSVNPMFIEHSAEQLKIKNDSKIIEDSLLELASRNFQIESFVTKELFEMNSNVDKALESIKLRELKKVVVNQQLAMTSMNNLALLLSDVLQQMQMQMAKKMEGDQQCNKPKNKPGGKKLSKMQQQLNDKIGQLKKSGKQGKELSKELAELAAEQEAIREALKEVEKGNNKGGNGEKSGDGDLKKLMEETEKDLVNKRLLDKTLKRQEDILTRLLESEKAMRERDLDEKREAQEAQFKNRIKPHGFENYIKEKEKQIELLKSISPSYSNYYKKEINKYFENETK